MLNSSDYAKNYASTIGKSLHGTVVATYKPGGGGGVGVERGTHVNLGHSLLNVKT